MRNVHGFTKPVLGLPFRLSLVGRDVTHGTGHDPENPWYSHRFASIRHALPPISSNFDNISKTFWMIS